MNVTIREHDVYSFRYNSEYIKEHASYDPYHCFDGQLIVKRSTVDGHLYLEDTYWSSDARRFTLEEAMQCGVLEFKCNLNDVIECSENDIKYYDEGVVIDLSRQHHHFKRFVRFKDAPRSKDAMLKSIDDAIEYYKAEIRSCEGNIKMLEEVKGHIINGEDIDKIYL